MKIVYIAHPVSNESFVKEKLAIIIRDINLKESDVVPFCPWFQDLYALDDNIPAERARGIRNDKALFTATFIHSIRLYGDRVSAGMIDEIKMANALQIKVVPMTLDTKVAYRELKKAKVV